LNCSTLSLLNLWWYCTYCSTIVYLCYYFRTNPCTFSFCCIVFDCVSLNVAHKFEMSIIIFENCDGRHTFDLNLFKDISIISSPSKFDSSKSQLTVSPNFTSYFFILPKSHKRLMRMCDVLCLNNILYPIVYYYFVCKRQMYEYDK